MKESMLRHGEIERSIITKYRKPIWRKFIKAVKDYNLVKEGDHIAICISGGKDSMLLAKCMEELKKHGGINFDLTYLVMDPGYKDVSIEKIKENAEILNIDITMFKTDIFSIVQEQTSGSPCYLCARMRRGCLYKRAQELGCNKIALGHHFNDVVETILLSMFYGGEYKSMRPILNSTNFEGMELIRPLYLVKEEDIISWTKASDLTFINCACMLTEKENEGKRLEIKNLIKTLKEVNPNIEYNIFASTENVNLDTILTYKTNDKKHNFLDGRE